MKIKNLFDNMLNEQMVLKTTKTKPIVDAIKNRKPISFMYIGPRKPKKDSVKAGKRIKVEAVAIGLSKRGNLIIRAYVQPPSVSKRGFEKHGWRTFMVSRMSNIEIHDNETFNNKRPMYQSGDDGSMKVTYVTTDWNVQPKTKKISKPALKPEKPQPKTTVKPIEPKSKPSEPTPQTTVEPTITPIQAKQKPEKIGEPKPKEEPKPEVKKGELKDIPKKQKPEKIGEPKPEEEPTTTQQNEPENDDENQLQETIKRFKTLIIY